MFLERNNMHYSIRSCSLSHLLAGCTRGLVFARAECCLLPLHSCPEGPVHMEECWEMRLERAQVAKPRIYLKYPRQGACTPLPPTIQTDGRETVDHQPENAAVGRRGQTQGGWGRRH